jgi:hypothetical protein
MESEDLPDRRLKIGGYKMLDVHLQDPSRFYKKALIVFGKENIHIHKYSYYCAQ